MPTVRAVTETVCYFQFDTTITFCYYPGMSDGVLNTALVQERIDANGWKRNWVFQQIGLKRSRGYQLIRDGLLPKDADEKDLVLQKLSDLIGVETAQLFLRLEKPRRRA